MWKKLNFGDLSKPFSISQAIDLFIRVIIYNFLIIYLFLMVNQHFIHLSPNQYRPFTSFFSGLILSGIGYLLVEKRNGSIKNKILFPVLLIVLFYFYVIPAVILLWILLIKYNPDKIKA